MLKAKFQIVLFLLLLSFASNAQLFTFRNYNYRNGLPIASITSIYTDENGMVYLGTDGAGLYQFNGESFEELANSSLKNHHVTSISNKGEHLYFTSKYQGVFEINKGTIRAHKVPAQLRGDWIRVFAFDESLFFANSRGFYVKDEKGQKKLHNFYKDVSIYQIVQLQQGILVFSSQGNFYYNPKSRSLAEINSWYNKSKSLSKMNFGFRKGNRVVLYDKKLTSRIEIVLTESDKVFSIKEKSMRSLFGDHIEVKSSTHNAKFNKTFFITVDDKLLVSDGDLVQPIEANYLTAMRNCNSIRADINGNIWCTSSGSGLYKISKEPFSRILTHNDFRRPDIFSIAKSDRDLVFCSFEGKTFLSKFKSEKLINYDVVSNQIIQDEYFFWLATETGVKRIDKATYALSSFPIKGMETENIMFLHKQGDFLYIGIYGKGLKKYDLNKKLFIELKIQGACPEYIYTVQHSSILQKNYFGTNQRLWEEDLRTGEVKLVPGLDGMGHFSGVSAKDAFGNFWFTCDNGLIGVLRNGEVLKVTDKKYFNSKLFYTINSDAYGNLILGTNKGLTFLKVDEDGNVLSSNFFTSKNGFDGYETNMRGQFQNDHEIIIATVEGLFNVDSKFIETLPKPTKPTIREIIQEEGAKSKVIRAFRVQVSNPVLRNVQYSYRILGDDDHWKTLTNSSIVYLDHLESGDYTFETRASYNGQLFSDVSTYSFSIEDSIFGARWLVMIFICIILAIALFAISKRKSVEGASFFSSNDLLVELRDAPSILLISAISNVAVNWFIPEMDRSLPNLLPFSFVCSFIMLISYVLSKIAQSTERNLWFRPLLVLTFSTFMLQNIVGLYVSNLHFFYVIGIILVNALAPYVFGKFLYVVVHNFFLIFVAAGLFIYLDQLPYNKYIFLVGILVSAVLSVFITYLRFDSLEKLLFISGIVNQGRVPVIVFNKSGAITFVSENVKDFFSISKDELLNKRISFLNQFLSDDDQLKSIDFTKYFADNNRYTAKMISNNQESIWVEWTCKVFAENINCIIGQDVSDRIEAENTYELLVESAEDLIYHTDINGVINFSNDRFNQFFGYDSIQDASNNSMKFVHPDFAQAVWDFYADHFRNRRKSSYFEFQVIDANGQTRWLGQHVSSRLNPHNNRQIIGFLVVARDITQNLENEKLIIEQNKEITSSIQYSKQIQQTLFTPKKVIDQLFEENFLLFKPKDIVSGDFYWFYKTDRKLLIAIGDCTGHGVPGAFMTLLGINLLNSIVIENHYHNPAQILNEMDKRLSDKLFKKTEESINDGIELTVCCLDLDTNALNFACAGSRFLIYSNNEFVLYKGDNKHVGDLQEGFVKYVDHHVQLNENDLVYFFTDGFQDQFGGLQDKRFSFRRLLETIESNALLPLEEQSSLIEDEFKAWKGEADQTDDVTIFAFRGIKR